MKTKKVSNQKTFDRIVKHLRKQGRKSITCETNADYNLSVYKIRYRTWDPKNRRILKCAIECLIPFRKYKPEMEKKSLVSLYYDYEFLSKYDLHLLKKFRAIHDYYEPENWEKHFKVLAEFFGLKYKEKK